MSTKGGNVFISGAMFGSPRPEDDVFSPARHNDVEDVVSHRLLNKTALLLHATEGETARLLADTLEVSL